MRRAFVTTVVVRFALLVPPVAIIVVLFVFRPADERLLYGGGLLSLLVFAVAVLAALRLWHARTLESVRRSTRQGAVVFLTQSLPTSLDTSTRTSRRGLRSLAAAFSRLSRMKRGSAIGPAEEGPPGSF